VSLIADEFDLRPFEKVALPQSDKGKRIKQRDYLPSGKLAVIDQGQSDIGGYTDDESMRFSGALPVIIFGDHTRAVKLVNHPFAVGADGIKIFSPAVDVLPKYLYYWMKSAPIENRGYGRHYQYLRKLSVPVPSLAKQQAIVDEIEKQFSRLDEAVANLHRVKANLKRYKASVLKAAVEGRLVETEASIAQREGRSYETGEQLLQRILETRRYQWHKKSGYKEPSQPALSDQGELPEGWTWTCVEQLNPGNRPCAYGVLQPGDDLGNGILFVRVGDINDGLIDFSDMKRIHPDIAAAYPRTNLKGGEVLLTLVGAIGRTAVVPSRLAGANVARAVGVLPVNELIDPHWVEMWFRNPSKIAEMTGKSHEVARKTLNLEDVRFAAVALPPKTEQARIVAEVDRHLSIIREVEAEVDASLQRSQALRQATLQRAFAQG
jgi:type I restriction enzyme S subunit